MTHSYNIAGMTCSGCVARVKNELLKSADIESVQVQLQSPQATITMSRHILLSQLQELVTNAGPYTISESKSA